MHDTWGETGAAARPEARASDDDRHRVANRLRKAAGAGLLGLDELEHRIGRAYGARTLPELHALTTDLPAPRAPAPVARRLVPPAFRDAGFQSHLTVYLLVIGMLVGIWAMGPGTHFWPFYPAAGWGIGLGAHFVAADHAQRRRRSRHRPPREGRSATEPGGAVATPVPPVATGATTRRYVVAMFVDVAGSTSLNEALGDQGWVRVRDHLRESVRECVEREQGWEVNAAGDGLLVRFDHPNRAACAAVEILRRLHQQRAESGFAPSVRVGIHSGDVVDCGDDLIGSVVNLAARVTSAAEPDQIIVTEHVADHLDPSFTTEDRGIHSLKGVSRPRHLLAVRWS